ncbi:hypothetical protein CNR22_11480 [Sphingobacteriaceae bacterium]|nr:hypothetical protein CNR22_11480 [Sphingobacteriaceae bacterium]
MKHLYLLVTALILFFSADLFSQNTTFWSTTNESSIRVTGVRQIIPQKFKTFSLIGEDLREKLYQAPHEKNTRVELSNTVIYLPTPSGSIQKFKVIESPVMAEELSLAYPQIKTFIVKGIDDPHATGRVDWNQYGFHGMIFSARGDYYIDPYCLGNSKDYISYYVSDFAKDPAHAMTEDGLTLIPDGFPMEPSFSAGKQNASPCVGAQLRTYRLAVACTKEYAKAATGSTGTVIPTVAQTLAKIVTSVNRVDGVYEREVAIRMVLVPTETLIIFTSAANDPFTGNNNSNTLIGESQTVITNNIGTANFDIGHTFSTGGGGLANLGCVCNAQSKASGITGSSYPVGDPYDIDYVAHEIGHQFRGNHTFNALTGSCSGNRNAGTSVEPGSGITIMAYAGICSPNDVSNHSIAYFHAISYDEIVNFSTSGSGNSCAVTTTTGNNPPVVTTNGNYIIPFSTPFIMTGSATDQDGDKLYYSWEETDAGVSGGNWSTGTAPFFRSYAPDSLSTTATEYSRYFPKKSVAASGNFTNTIGEYLPKTPQVLNFRLTARDKKMGGGGSCYASAKVTLDNAGPFMLTYPSTGGIIWPAGTSEALSWDVNGTDHAPVSCDSVRVYISYDSGANYSVFISSTPNDGYEAITVPALASTTTTCRIKIESIGNIFYDVSNNNFTISNGPVNLVGISQISENNPMGLSVWPNPFADHFSFRVGHLNSSDATVVTVVDLLGHVVLQNNYTNKSQLMETLDLTTLSNGVYFIKVSNDSKQSVHRIVKN